MSAAAGAATDAASPPNEAQFTKAVVDLCSWTGMRRPAKSQIQRVEPFDRGSVLYLDLIVDGDTRAYRVSLDTEQRVTSFMPQHFNFGDVGLGYDTHKDQRARAMCLRAIYRVNDRLGWKWVSGPQMQRVGQNYVVSFETVSEEEQSESGGAFLDPYVSFLITPKGTVFGGFWGA